MEKARQQLNEYEQRIESLRQQLQQRDQEHDQNLLRLKSQSMGGDSRTNLQENIDMIRLQRDLRDKSDELRRLQTQNTNFESVSSKCKESFSSIALIFLLAKSFSSNYQCRIIKRNRTTRSTDQRRTTTRSTITFRITKWFPIKYISPRSKSIGFLFS